MTTSPRLTVLALALLALASTSVAASESDTRFEALTRAEWNFRNDRAADAPSAPAEHIDAHLPRVDEAAQQKKLAYWEGVLAKLSAIDPATLTPQHAQDAAVYRYQIETLIADQRFKTYQRPLSGDTAFWSDQAEVVEENFHAEDDYRRYLSQLADLPRWFQDNVDNMRAGLRRGFTLPWISLQGRDATVARVVDAKTIADNLYYTPFRSMPASLPAKTQAALRAQAEAVIRDQVIPAHRALLKFLREEYIPGATKSLAAADLPDGPAFYQSQIREYTTLDMTADQIHALGLAEVARITGEMNAIREQVGFQGDLPAFNAWLRTAPQFYVKTPQELLDRAAWTAKRFDNIAARWFGRLPRARFGIVPVAPDVAPFYTAGRGGPGVYLVNTWNLPARPLYTLTALTLHESAPGHAFQMPLAAENKRLPAFRQESYISAYGEGWALYCERLGDEMGLYDTPYERFGMLSYQMWRAARLVVDTGIHTRHWTREQAQAYLLANTALSTHEVETEVDRYIAWPGQALSYYLGEMAIWKDRRKAEAALGERFDIRHFHDAVLDLGSVPLGVLDAAIDRFIADGGRSPYGDND
jgi:uncharacterized protein (DUF885 family)